MLKKIKINIAGIHCASCKTLIETELNILSGVNNVDVNYVNGESEIEYEEEKININKIIKTIEKLNYKVSDKDFSDSEQKKNNKQKLVLSMSKYFLRGILFLIFLLIFIFGYFIIKELGTLELLSKLNDGQVSFFLIFVIGFLSSFHCVGMCGGLVIAYSTKDMEKKNKINVSSHFQYNLGRFISYTIIGGVLGGLGSFFGINPYFTGIITIIAGIFMVLMGLSFMTHGKVLEKIKIRTPQFIAKFLYNQKYSKNPKTPLVIGLLTGFMPCGPLQAMQLYALASGSMLNGAIVMSVYSLGTIPLMFGFGIVLSKIASSQIKNIMKISGILVLLLGIFMFNRGLVNFGYGFTFFSEKENILLDSKQEFQEIKMDLTYFGYKPNILYIKEKIPVRWIIDVKQMTGCTNAIMIESLGIKKDLKIGKNIIEFIPPANVSEIKFSCWMRMVWGKFIIVVDGEENSLNIDDLPQSSCDGSCGNSICDATTDGACGCGS